MQNFSAIRLYIGVLLSAIGVLVAVPSASAQAPAWQTAIAVGMGANGVSQVNASATDAAGNVYLVGVFSSTVSFGSLTLTTNSIFNYDAFVAKWSPATGGVVWARQLGGPLVDVASTVVVNGTSVYVGGNFQGTASFESTSLTSAASYDGFVAKFTDLGTGASLGWVQQLGGNGGDYINGMAVSGPNIFVAGTVGGATASFGSIVLTNGNTGANGYIAKLVDVGPGSNYAWAYGIASASFSNGYQVAVSGSSVYLAGTMEDVATFGSISKTSAGHTDAFIAKLLDSGNTAAFVWVQPVGGSSNDYGYGVAVAGTSVYLAGNFQGSATFGTATLASTGGRDGFVLKCTDNGSTCLVGWVQQLGGLGDLVPYSPLATNTGIYVTGLFYGDFSAGNVAFPATGGRDVFVLKLTDGGIASNVAWGLKAGSTSDDQALSLFPAPGGRLYAGGSVGGPATFGTLVLGGGGSSNTGFLAALADPTLAATMPTLSTASVEVFPNPAHGHATVQLPAGTGPAMLTVLDALGRAVCTQTAPGAKAELNLTGLPAGFYAVRVQAGGVTAIQQLVVE